jgi:ribosomal protein S18 acetylase RimI-like enzyme
VSAVLEDKGWELRPSATPDLDELMRWFPNAQSVGVWGGPRFRFPFSGDSFKQDCHWHKMATYSLYNPANAFSGFGQFYERIGRINLARLVAHPEMRGQGVGRRLVSMLMTVAAEQMDPDEFSLFVYRDNIPALSCYQGLGFKIQDYPEPDDRVFADTCYYLTRPV